MPPAFVAGGFFYKKFFLRVMIFKYAPFLCKDFDFQFIEVSMYLRLQGWNSWESPLQKRPAPSDSDFAVLRRGDFCHFMHQSLDGIKCCQQPVWPIICFGGHPFGQRNHQFRRADIRRFCRKQAFFILIDVRL